MTEKGLFCRKDSAIKEVGAPFGFDETDINFIREDNEQNIWVGTYGKGIFCFNNLYISNYTTNEGLSSNYITDILTDKEGRILTGTYRGLNIIEDGCIVKGEGLSPELGGYIWELSDAGESGVLVGKGSGPLKTIEYNGFRLITQPATSLCITGDGNMLTGNWYNTLSFSGKGIKKDSVISLGENLEAGFIYNRTNSLLYENPGGIWAGTSKGLWLIKNGIATGFQDDNILGACIWDIRKDYRGNVWIASSGGVVTAGENGFMKYTAMKGYDLTSAVAVDFDHKGRTWVGTPHGLFILNGDSLMRLDRNSGLISSEITCLHFDSIRGNMLAGTVQGLSVICLQDFDSYTYPRPRLYYMIDGFPTGSINKKIRIPYKESNLKVSFSPVYFRNPEAVSFQYILKGKSSDWTGTGNNSLDFAFLGPGDYNLLIRAKGESGIWTEPVGMPFYIVPPFWKTTLFIILSFFLVLAGTIMIMLTRYRLAKRRMDEKLALTDKITELKYQAFSAAMNPHFIFNSLNSIQHFINTSDAFSANEYLAKFSRLIRMNLEGAGKGEIKLSDEIKKIEAYLELEKMRFGTNLGYRINTGNGIIPEKIKIPNMIIQPFIENAIWHGILPKQKGTVEISFEKDSPGNLIIRIIDDGIGIEAGKMNKRSDHVSMGIKIISERLEMIRKETDTESLLLVTDLSSGNTPGKSGTEARITLPPDTYSFTG